MNPGTAVQEARVPTVDRDIRRHIYIVSNFQQYIAALVTKQKQM
jgi:hypothetical protein